MSRPRYRGLPPVAVNVEFSPNASLTLLDRQARCPRSAFLYRKYRGGLGSHEMHRGSLLHETWRQATLQMIEMGEPQMPWEVGKDLLAAVAMAHPEWVIPPKEMDVARLAMFHWCECTVIDPGAVLAVEQLFELPMGRFNLRGKVDLALAIDGGVAIRDYKTQAQPQTQEDFDDGLQLPVYSLLIAEGYPVREETCGECMGDEQLKVDVLCPSCGGSGRSETPQPRIGERFGLFDVAEVYPRPEPWGRDDGARELAWRGGILTRQELVDQKLYVESLLAGLAHGYDTGEWEAVGPATHCDTCAAKPECPLPGHLLSHAGRVNTLEEAQEAGAKLVFDRDRNAARLKELRNFAKAHDVSIRVGPDLVFGFVATESEEWITGKRIGRPDTAAAREAMEGAIARAQQLGEPFDYREFRRMRHGSEFRLQRLSPEEVAELDAEPAVERDFGEVPF